MAALETRVFELIQEERHKLDPAAKTLALDSELADVARRHSEDMAAKNYVAHAGPDGQTSASLIMAQDADFQGLLGENIATQNFSPQSGVDVESFAHRFVQTWLDSPEHKENLSFAQYDRSGVGAAVGGNTVYVTQLFATDLGLQRPGSGNPQQILELRHPVADANRPGPTVRGDPVPIPIPRPSAQNRTP